MKRLLLSLALVLGLISTAGAALVQVNTTSSQTISNKTFDSTNTYQGGTLSGSFSGGTFTGSQTFSSLSTGVAYFDASKVLSSLTLTDGQLAIGSTGAIPVAASLTGTANQITVTGGAGSITLSTPQNIGTGSSPTFTAMTFSSLTASSIVGLDGSKLTTSLTIPLSRANGGTHLSAGCSANQVLGENSGATDYECKTLTNGGGVSIAHTTNTVTLLASIPKFIYGYTYANNSTDPTNDIDIAAGGAMDSTNAKWIVGSALTKQLDNLWSVGTNAGALDTGVIGNSDYYIWAILRSDTGVVDYLFSLSSTAPTMPASYDYKRLIGWFKRVGGTIVAFHTYETEGGGLELSWDAPTTDIDLANTLTTSRRTDAVKVPLNFSVIANLHITALDASASYFVLVVCPDHTDVAPSTSTNSLFNMYAQGSAADQNVGYLAHIRTSAAGLIASRSTLATVDQYRVSTQGFTWARRN